MVSALKKRHFIIGLIVIGSLSIATGCSDLTDKYGDLLPGFLKPKAKTEEPIVHKLKPGEEIRSSAPVGGTGFTPSAVVPIGEEGIPGKPTAGGPAVTGETTETAPVAPGKKAPAPGTETATKEGDKSTPPAGLDNQSKPAAPGTNKTPSAPDKKGAPTPDNKAQPPAPSKTTPETTAGGGTSQPGEDVAMIALVPEAGAPALTGSKPVDSLMDKEYVYDPTGKRDPFRPFNLRVEKKSEVPPEELTPLQRYNLSQLKLTAIIYDSEKGTGIAMVEAPDKKGYNIVVGSEVGGGKVVRITETDVQVEVRYEDFYGNTEKRIETLKIAGGR
jgi:type IV pilus assembly protein PilP